MTIRSYEYLRRKVRVAGSITGILLQDLLDTLFGSFVTMEVADGTQQGLTTTWEPVDFTEVETDPATLSRLEQDMSGDATIDRFIVPTPGWYDLSYFMEVSSILTQTVEFNLFKTQDDTFSSADPITNPSASSPPGGPEARRTSDASYVYLEEGERVFLGVRVTSGTGTITYAAGHLNASLRRPKVKEVV